MVCNKMKYGLQLRQIFVNDCILCETTCKMCETTCKMSETTCKMSETTCKMSGKTPRDKLKNDCLTHFTGCLTHFTGCLTHFTGCLSYFTGCPRLFKKTQGFFMNVSKVSTLQISHQNLKLLQTILKSLAKDSSFGCKTIYITE